jgi:hypothetical protein
MPFETNVLGVMQVADLKSKIHGAMFNKLGFFFKLS